MPEFDDLHAAWGHGGWCGEKTSSSQEEQAVNGPVPRAIPMVEERLDSRDLFATGRIVSISHCGQTYQLRLTAQNKLILTK